MKKGGCVLIDKDTFKVGLVYRSKLNDYTFPKGHIEEGENTAECALRETEEETGRVCKLLSDEPLKVIEYTNYEGSIYNYLYLAIDMGKTTKEIKEEDKEELVWVDYDQVLDKLTYPDLREFWIEQKDKIKDMVKGYKL